MTGMTLIGEGWIRTVYLAEYGGRKVAVKTLRHMDNLTSQKKHLKMHMREVLTLDAVRFANAFEYATINCPREIPNYILLCTQAPPRTYLALVLQA